MEQEQTTIKDKLKTAIGTDLYNQLDQTIQDIEKSLPITKNHYGKYMAILGTFPEEKRLMMANVFIILGGNKEGIIDALKLMR